MSQSAHVFGAGGISQYPPVSHVAIRAPHTHVKHVAHGMEHADLLALFQGFHAPRGQYVLAPGNADVPPEALCNEI